ncbi:hypothetical protein K1719_036883 [Acacia pycnantha]|nr:hypothetical protein K1719_036883 [Acacia pycnantha]
MASTTTKEIVTEIPTLARVYNDGTVERFNKIKVVPPSVFVPDQKTRPAVSSKDVVISENPFVAARLYIQQKQRAEGDERIPIFVYFHGGGFIIESAFSPAYHGHFNEFLSVVDVIVVSVEYRIAPEHYLPAAYNDCWTALNWVASHPSTHSQRNSDVHGHSKALQISTYNALCRLYDTPSYFKNLENSSNSTEPWLLNYGNFEEIFVGGDSAGGNIVHNVAMRAGSKLYTVV